MVPSRSLVDLVADWGQKLFAPLPWARPLPAESLHVTLAFLGELDRAAVERAGEIVDAVDRRRVELHLGPALVVVPRRRPRVLALTAAGEGVADLHARVTGSLAAADLFERDPRPFWPHLSVARIKRGTLDGKRGRVVVEALPRLAGAAAVPQPAARVVLYRSDLGPERATYTVLAHTDLTGA